VDLKFIPRKILYSTFGGERLVGKLKKRVRHKKLAKIRSGETRVE
jgi:hypothetical protein